MKRSITSTALALAATLVISTVAAAWHVDVTAGARDPIAPKVTAKSFGPKGDPWHRIVVKVGPVRYGPCIGSVSVPDAKWANGTTLTVDGTSVAIGRGQSAPLPAGDYVGRWSNSQEVEHFTIACRTFTPADSLDVRIGFRFVGKQGIRVIRKTIAPGCTYRSPWVWMKGGTKFWVQDNTNGKRLLTRRAAPPGFYGPLYHGYTKGISCK